MRGKIIGMLKSLFISIYLVLLVAIFGYGLTQYIAFSSVGWLAAFLCPLIPLIFFANLFINRPAEVGGWRMIVLPLILAAWGIDVGISAFEYGFLHPPIISGALVVIGWLVYDNLYAGYGKHKGFAKGVEFPTLNLIDDNGDPVSLSPADHEFNIYIFHRGSWCPFCVAQAREIGSSYEELTALGAQITFITDQKAAKNRWMQAKTGGQMRFMTDSGYENATKLGLLDKNALPLGLQLFGYKSHLARPATIITDRQNTVISALIASDYRRRPLPERILKILRNNRVTNSQNEQNQQG